MNGIVELHGIMLRLLVNVNVSNIPSLVLGSLLLVLSVSPQLFCANQDIVEDTDYREGNPQDLSCPEIKVVQGFGKTF